MSHLSRYLAAAALLGFAGMAPVHAQTFTTGVGAAMPIPDADGATLIPGQVFETLNVTSTATLSSFNSLTIFGLNHTYIGDLLGTITHNGITVDLFDHTGADNNPDFSDPNYNAGQGIGASFSRANTYTFAPTGLNLAGVADPSTVASGTYKATGNTTKNYDQQNPLTPNPTLAFDPANATKTLSAFNGQSLSGNWTLTLSDFQPNNTGSFTGFSFNATPAAVPEASSVITFGLLLLLGAGGLTLHVRRASRVPAAD